MKLASASSVKDLCLMSMHNKEVTVTNPNTGQQEQDYRMVSELNPFMPQMLAVYESLLKQQTADL